MSKIAQIIIFSLLLSCTSSKVCDDCMHYPIELIIRDNSSDTVVTCVTKIIINYNGRFDTLVPSVNNGVLRDSMYCISGNEGTYSLTVVQNGYDTIQIDTIIVKRNECNVITKVITVGTNKTSSVLGKRMGTIIRIEESEDCG